MSSIHDEVDLTFNGLSGTECEAFIRAVRKHAFTEGKTRDPAYMADYASTCMDGPALRWFDELDPDIQSDWNQLRSALLAKYPADYNADTQPSTSSNATSAFIPTPAAAPPPAALATSSTMPPVYLPPVLASVPGMSEKEKSTSAPSWRHTDDLSSDDDDDYDAYSGRSPSPPPPLRSSEKQAAPPPPPQVRQRTSSPPRRADPPQSAPSWPTPQVYSNPRTSSPPRRANPPPTTPVPVRRPMDTTPRMGRIVVQVEGSASKKRYLRAKLNQAGFFKCTTSTWNCLRVQYVPSYEPSIIQLLNCDADENLLGITWDQRNGEIVPQALGPDSTLCGDVGAVSGAPVVSSTSSSKSGRSGSAIWRVDNRGYIQAIWTDSRTGGTWPLDILFMSDWIYIAGNAESFMSSKDTQIYKKARFYFEAA